jgi:hypothetical protein
MSSLSQHFDQEIPLHIQTILNEYELNETNPYGTLELVLSKIQPLGWTFEYGLDGIPYDFRQIGKRELSLTWWNSLSDSSKLTITIEFFGGSRNFATLTGREIESLYYSDKNNLPNGKQK